MLEILLPNATAQGLSGQLDFINAQPHKVGPCRVLDWVVAHLA